MVDSPEKLTRRRFVKQCGLLSGAAAVGLERPHRALAQKDTPPSERIALGCIGMGGMGQQHLKWFGTQADVQIVGVCDVDRRRFEEAKNVGGHHDFQQYDDFRELLANDAIDAVVIATPDHWHGLATVAAAQAGKDIYCEKPLTNSIDEGRAVCRAVEKNNVVLQTGSHERSNPGAAIAKQLIREGRFGEIQTVRIQLPTDEPHLQTVKNFRGIPPEMAVPKQFDYDFWLGPAPLEPFTEKRCHFWWRFISDYGGGEMTDRGCHVIDLAQYILGKDDTGPVSIQARGVVPTAGLYDAILDFTFEARFADGLRMLGNNDSPRGVWFEGTAGKLFVKVHGADLSAEPKSLLADVSVPAATPYASHRREFLDAVKDRSAVIAPAEAGHRTATICHLNNLALRLDRSFDWEPQSERSTDPEVNALLTPNVRAPWSLDG
jgi:predicted dehydrogenase